MEPVAARVHGHALLMLELFFDMQLHSQDWTLKVVLARATELCALHQIPAPEHNLLSQAHRFFSILQHP